MDESAEMFIFRNQNKIIVKVARVESREEKNVYIYNTTTNEWTSMCVDIFKDQKEARLLISIGKFALIFKFQNR